MWADIGPTSARYRFRHLADIASTLQNRCRADIGGLCWAAIVNDNGPISARCEMFAGNGLCAKKK